MATNSLFVHIVAISTHGLLMASVSNNNVIAGYNLANLKAVMYVQSHSNEQRDTHL